MNFNHFDTDGNAIMVDISKKDITKREATATGCIRMNKECFESVKNGGTKKGDVLGVAQIAGIMACKRTSDLIPLSHPIDLNNSKITFIFHDDENTIKAICTARCDGKTGVEMEVLTGVSIALLTIYDMCKSIDKNMEINGIHLTEKSGGKSGHFQFDKKGSLL